MLSLIARGAAAAAALALFAGTLAAQTPPPPEVTVSAPLAKDLVEWQEFTGQFAATASVEIRARVSGYLMQVHFRDGAEVEKDQLLYTIDRRPFELALEAARAERAEAEAAKVLAEAQMARTESLQRENVAAVAALDERRAQLSQAEAQVRAADTAIAQAWLDLNFTEIRAPIAGRVSYNRVTEGNLVEEGATVLTTIVAEAPVWFEFDMSETNYLRYVRAYRDGRLASTRDESVEVQVRLFDEDGFDRIGNLYFVDNQVERSTGTIRVRARFDNEDRLLTPGQFGILRMPASELYTAILVPDEAVVSDQSNKIVLTVNDENIVVPKVVRAGPREFGLRIIREGLSAEDRIVINGVARARPGETVTPVAGEIILGDGRR
ncbi:MAG TPA: efflux RND transporter periplasmic adaptor subunit [Paracoccaceae bacterium]|nr:efflux RND transporter periplasmic adaptor subunit [Paracoccaceae bacterium]